MKKTQVAVVSLGSLFTASAFAAVPAEVTTAISSAGTDAAILGGLVLAVLIGIAAFKWLRSAGR